MKRIITCSDGTWDKPGNKDHGKVVRSNVQKIFQVIAKRDPNGIDQIKHYDDGVGAVGNIFERALNGATGGGLDANIIDAYKFIVWNYEPGDELYLFGFSRGAYTARSLAGMIRKCGILKNQDLSLIDEAYAFYRKKSPESAPGKPESENFINTNSYRAPIKFIGVWDTVGSLGIPLSWFNMVNRQKYKFHDLTLSSIIQNAYQAMAINEHRELFDVNLWKRSKTAIAKDIHQVVEQRWFAGVHCDVGGGYREEQLSDLTLQWMIDKAQLTDLHIDMSMAVVNKTFPVFMDGSATGKQHESRTGIYLLSGNHIRKVGQHQGFNECIDSSVFTRMADKHLNYAPQNLLDGIARGVKQC